MAAQLPDRIILDGRERILCSNPLEAYWLQAGKKRPRFCSSANCRRGYIATWAISDQQLFLTGIDGEYMRWFLLKGRKLVKCSLKAFFKRAKGNVKATWFSGRLRIPNGRMILFADEGYDSRYEQETIVTVAGGNVTRQVTLDNTHQILMME